MQKTTESLSLTQIAFSSYPNNVLQGDLLVRTYLAIALESFHYNAVSNPRYVTLVFSRRASASSMYSFLAQRPIPIFKGMPGSGRIEGRSFAPCRKLRNVEK
jgi:hypothetical protein